MKSVVDAVKYILKLHGSADSHLHLKKIQDEEAAHAAPPAVPEAPKSE